jgi:hypothetical protein
MEINNSVQSSLINTVNNGKDVAQQIAISVLKDSASQTENMVQKLIVDGAQQVQPRTSDSTFEFIA